jgi:hypothetical protein
MGSKPVGHGRKPIRERLAGTKAAVRWRVPLLKGTPAKFLGYVEAAEEKAATDAAAKEYKIAEALRSDSCKARRMTGARYQIAVDGQPRSNRDDKTIAICGSRSAGYRLFRRRVPDGQMWPLYCWICLVRRPARPY